MVSVDAQQWDETICNMLACQHPPCWEAIRRIESGHPRIVLGALDSPRRESPDYEGELPTLKIVNLPLNCSRREGIKCSESYGSVSKTISSIKDTRSYFSNSTQSDIWIPPISVVSSERDSFPGLNSQMDSQTPHFSPISFTCWRQTEKVQVTDISEFAVNRLDYRPPCGNLVVRWIPSTRPRRLPPKKQPARAATPPGRMCVKDLALESIPSFKENLEAKRKKSSKVPTGGQPYLLHLRKNKLGPADKSSLVGKGRNAKQSTLRKRQFSSCSQQLTPLVSSRDEGNLKTDSRRGTLLERKEKGTPPLFIVQKAPSLCRFETKITVKEEYSRRIHRQLRLPGGSVPRWHPMPELVEQVDSADAGGYRRGGGRGGGSIGSSGSNQPDKRTRLFQEAAAEEWSPPVPPVAHPRRNPLVKFMECKGTSPRLLTAGHDNFVPRILRMESKEFCEPLVSQKECPPPAEEPPPAMLSTGTPWQPTDTPRGETLPQLQSPNPPPPPPSPSFLGSSENSSLD